MIQYTIDDKAKTLHVAVLKADGTEDPQWLVKSWDLRVWQDIAGELQDRASKAERELALMKIERDLYLAQLQDLRGDIALVCTLNGVRP